MNENAQAPQQHAREQASTFGDHPLQASNGGASQSAPAFQLKTGSGGFGPVQRKVETHFGEFNDEKYEKAKFGATGRGAEIEISFKPGDNVDATKIGLSQSVRSVLNGNPFFPNSDTFYESRAIDKKDAIAVDQVGSTDEGTMIDRVKRRNNPVYGGQTLGAGEKIEDTDQDNNSTSADTELGVNANYNLGHHYMDGDTRKTKNAGLYDFPKRRSQDVSKNSGQIFETTAIALDGAQKGSYYGSVQWGWKTDAAGKFDKIPFEKVSEGVPSSTFLKAAEKWNGGKSSTGDDNADLPTVDVKVASADVTQSLPADFVGPPLTLPKGTRVSIQKASAGGKNGVVKVVDGPFTGNTVELSAADMGKMKDERA